MGETDCRNGRDGRSTMASANSETLWGDVSVVRRAKMKLCASPPPPHPPSARQAQLGADVSVQGNVARDSKRQRLGVEDSMIEGEGKPLKVVYWNVANIPAKDIDTFLGDLDEELQWDVLILFECSAARREIHLSGVRRAGHLVAAQPFENGRRAGALVFSSTSTGA